MNVFKTDVVEATTIDVPTNEGKIKATNIKINPTYLNKGDIIEM